MKLYLHVDRWNRLKQGDIINRVQYWDISPLTSMLPFADDGFLQHLEKLCREGLSLYGSQYLAAGLLESPPCAVNFLTELYFEYIRSIHYKNMPSRLQSLFAFGDLKQAKDFKAKNKNVGRIFEIEFSGRCFIGDMERLKCLVNANTQKYMTLEYWEGKPFSAEESYIPAWEYVIDLPVTIGKEITD